MARLMSSRQCVASDTSPGTRTARRPASSIQRAVSLALIMFAKIRNQQIGAFSGKGNRNRPTDPGIGAGDECGAASQLAITPIGMLTVIRIGIHLGGKPLAGLMLAAKGDAVPQFADPRSCNPIFQFWCEGPDRPRTLTVETGA